jgi:hypothetical protein
MGAHACHPSNSRKYKIGGSQSRLVWAKSKTLSIIKAKRAGSMAQVVKYQPKNEALSLNPSTTKTK